MDFDAAHQFVMREDKAGLPNRGGSSPGGHLQQGVPRTGEWVLPSLVCSPLLEQLAIELLRGPCFLSGLNGNTNLPGSGTQGLHSDVGWRLQSVADAAAEGEPWPPEADCQLAPSLYSLP